MPEINQTVESAEPVAFVKPSHVFHNLLLVFYQTDLLTTNDLFSTVFSPIYFNNAITHACACALPQLYKYALTSKQIHQIYVW